MYSERTVRTRQPWVMHHQLPVNEGRITRKTVSKVSSGPGGSSTLVYSRNLTKDDLDSIADQIIDARLAGARMNLLNDNEQQRFLEQSEAKMRPPPCVDICSEESFGTGPSGLGARRPRGYQGGRRQSTTTMSRNIGGPGGGKMQVTSRITSTGSYTQNDLDRLAGLMTDVALTDGRMETVRRRFDLGKY